MDFKRIEWIFLVVFIGINIFLGIEIFQTPTLLTNSHSSSITPSDLTTEMAGDNITIPKLSSEQGDGYYLSAKVNNDWIQKVNKQLDNSSFEISNQDGILHIKLNDPVSVSSKHSKLIKELNKFKDDSKNVYQGKKYVYIPELSSKGEYTFAQKTGYGLIFSTTARLHITVKNNQIVSYTQAYTDEVSPARERQNTISAKAAVDSLYTYSELPNDSKVIWVRSAYSKLIEVRGSRIFLPTWVVAIQNNNTKTVTLKRVNAFNGNVLQENAVEDKDEK